MDSELEKSGKFSVNYWSFVKICRIVLRVCTPVMGLWNERLAALITWGVSQFCKQTIMVTVWGICPKHTHWQNYSHLVYLSLHIPIFQNCQEGICNINWNKYVMFPSEPMKQPLNTIFITISDLYNTSQKGSFRPLWAGNLVRVQNKPSFMSLHWLLTSSHGDKAEWSWPKHSKWDKPPEELNEHTWMHAHRLAETDLKYPLSDYTDQQTTEATKTTV